MKFATTIDEQIEKLKSRGMNFRNVEKAKEILLDIGYYRLGFYWFFFEKDTNNTNRAHTFKENIYFEDVVELYYFDTDLRNLLSTYLHRLEINIRTRIIYHISNKYKHYPTWFADPKIVNRAFTEQTLPSAYREIKKRNKVILNHHTKHINDRYAPAWKTLEYMTFGCVIMLYDNLKNEEDKHLISDQYGLRNPKVFSSYLEAIRQLRNKCAHGHPIFPLVLPKRVKIGTIPLLNTPKTRDNIIGAISVLLYFLDYVSKNRKEELSQEINSLISRMTNKAAYKIISFMNVLSNDHQ